MPGFNAPLTRLELSEAIFLILGIGAILAMAIHDWIDKWRNLK